MSGLAGVANARLAARLLWREARSGELTLMAVALVLAVMVSTAIALFSQRLDLAMSASAQDLLGADLRVRSTTPLSDNWQVQASEVGLEQARTVEFPSVVVAGERMTLAAIKAVDDGYPLRGELRVRTHDSNSDTNTETNSALQQHGPGLGEAWVEPRVLALLGVTVGDSLSLGGETLRLTGVIEKESDRGGNFYSLSPRVMVHWSQVQGSPLLGPGSRLTYRLLLSGPEAAREQFAEQIVLEANQSLERLGDGNRAMATSLDRARRYLGLAAILAVVLASIAIAITARRFSERHYDTSALMRTFGLSRTQVLRIFLWQMVILALVSTLIGALAALALQAGLMQALSGLIPEGLPPAGWQAWAVGLSTGALSLFGFGVPHLLPLSAVSPLRVLRRELTPVPLHGWVLSLLALSALTVLLVLLTQDVLLSVGLMLGGALVLLLLMAGLQGALRFTGRYLSGRALPLSVRFAWQHLSGHRTATAGQVLAFALTLMVMLIIGLLRNDLLADWQRSLPQDAPNVFAINIQAYETEAFQQALSDRGLTPKPLYPVLPMRLIAVNQVAVSELPIADDRSINRDLISSVAERLPQGNTVTAGDWQATVEGPAQVSVEEEVAERLGFALGDVLTFRAAGQTVDVTIGSLRSLDWTTMTPNFFMMLSADVMNTLPLNYMTSFHLPADKEADFVSLIQEYPGVTLIDTRALLSQVQSLIERLTLAVELILLCVLAGAILVMLAVLLTTTRARLEEGAVLRTLGASRQQLIRAQRTEFVILGGVSALLALLGGEAVAAGLYLGLLDLPYRSLGWAWLILPPLTVLALWLPGQWMLRPVTRVAPLTVLRGL
ncbi:MAG: FtsX-like permease family protein [Pseudomonadota bacterium]|nr:FtsX-like permease family protein [Pseudomonadota bacterium]